MAKDTVLNIRLSAEEKLELESMAVGRGLTVAGLVRAWVVENRPEQAKSGNGAGKKLTLCPHGIYEGGRCSRCPNGVSEGG